MIKVRWTGAAGLEFITDQDVFLIDPYLSRLGKFQMFFQRVSANTDVIEEYLENLPSKPSGIVISHTHADHALDIPFIAQNSKCQIVGSKSLDSLLKMHGLLNRVIVCESDNGHEPIELGDNVSVVMIPSVHGKAIFGRVPFPGEIDPNETLPMKASGYRHGAVFISKIKIDDITFMHLGSADYIESQLDGHTCDVLFICVPDWKKKSGYTSRLIDIVQPEVIVLFHFDDFSRVISKTGRTPILPFQDISGFIGEIKKHTPKVKIILPEINTDLGNELF
ncbi:MAG: MBL fold metallo-hydrolase [Desulfobacteraceae bacterium]|nr:MBL fold metallo-hydrolase [Desulfobacteraceae bacterium]